MIADAATLTAQGALVHHIHYQELTTNPEEACRRVCDFLEVDSAPAMLNLAEADLSAVYAHPHHSHLRGGVIEASRSADLPGSPNQIAKLERFTRRWNRQSGAWQTTLAVVPDGPEPSLWERTRHRFTGAVLHSWDGAKRALFEFLPLAWLHRRCGSHCLVWRAISK